MDELNQAQHTTCLLARLYMHELMNAYARAFVEGRRLRLLIPHTQRRHMDGLTQAQQCLLARLYMHELMNENDRAFVEGRRLPLAAIRRCF